MGGLVNIGELVDLNGPISMGTVNKNVRPRCHGRPVNHGKSNLCRPGKYEKP